MRLTFVLLFWFAGQISVISHRGEHLAHPENTLPAFQAAIDAGADYFELDVRTTADGRLVLMHDSTVDRTTNGTNPLFRPRHTRWRRKQIHNRGSVRASAQRIVARRDNDTSLLDVGAATPKLDALTCLAGDKNVGCTREAIERAIAKTARH